MVLRPAFVAIFLQQLAVLLARAEQPLRLFLHQFFLVQIVLVQTFLARTVAARPVQRKIVDLFVVGLIDSLVADSDLVGCSGPADFVDRFVDRRFVSRRFVSRRFVSS